VPGDVVVMRTDKSDVERVVEVRDKIVTHDDLLILATRAADKGVSDAIMVAVASGQPDIRFQEAQAWAAQKGIALTIFQDWATLIRQVLLWSSTPTLMGARNFPRIMQERLVALGRAASALV
jgi:hypothetical protein